MSLTFQRVRVENFRGVGVAEVSFAASGVTVVYAPNESGKSSLIEAIDLVMRTKSSSRSQQVRAVQPVGRDVGSLVELELTCGEYQMIVRKRFNRDSMTELEIISPAREQLSGDEAHDRLREVIEAAVDENLFSALWLRQGRTLDSLRLGDSSALAQALDARAGGAGVRADDALVDRVRAEFGRYFTPGGSDGQALRQVDADVEQRRRRLDELDRQLHEVDADIAALERLARDLAALGERAQEARSRQQDLRQRQSAVEAARRALDAVAGNAKQALARRELADERLRKRQELLAEIDGLQVQIRRLNDTLEPDRRGERELSTQLDEADAAVREALDAERRATTARERASRVEVLVRRRDEELALSERTESVRVATERVARAQAILESNRVTQEVLERIWNARDQRQRAWSLLQAGAPELTLTAHRQLDLGVSGQPLTLPAGGTHAISVDDRVLVDVEPYLSIEVRAGTSIAALRADLDDAASQLASALAAAGVESIDAAGPAARSRSAAEQDRAHAQSDLAALLRDQTREELLNRLESVRAEIQELTRTGGPSPADTTIQQAELAVEAATELETSCRNAAANAREARGVINDQLAGLRQRLAAQEASLRSRSDDLAAKARALQAARAETPDDQLEAGAQQASSACEDLAAEARAAEQELLALEPEVVEALSENVAKELQDLRKQAQADETEQVKLTTRVSLRGEEGLGEQHELAQLELEDAIAKQSELRSRAAAARALKEEIERAHDEAYTAYREPLRRAIVDRGTIVFGRGFDVTLDDELAIVSRTLDGTVVPWASLSSGAREQLAVLTGIAVGSLASAGGVPLVLDDALGYTDPRRLEALGALLGRVNEAQVIVLTCVPDRFSHTGGARRVSLTATAPVEADRAPSEVTVVALAAAETLSCERCGREWTRARTRGRKPRLCPDCAGAAGEGRIDSQAAGLSGAVGG